MPDVDPAACGSWWRPGLGALQLGLLACGLWVLALGAAPAVRAQQGIWTTSAELAGIPMKGPAWDQLLADAQMPISAPSLSNQNSPMNVRALAKALVYARTNDPNYRQEVIALFAHYGEGGIFETENASEDSLPLSRELAAYVIAADLVVLDATTDAAFRTWLSAVRNEVFPTGGR